jgi:hypothetical protein
VPITLLKEAEQFGIFAFDEFKILISQLAPLPFGFAFQLVPAAFDFVQPMELFPLLLRSQAAGYLPVESQALPKFL